MHNVGGIEYLLAAFFSAVSAVFGYLTRRAAKRNETKLSKVHEQTNEIQKQTNGELSRKIAEAVTSAVDHDELVRAVSEEAIRNYLDGLLMARLADDEVVTPNILDDIMHITERRKNDPGVHTEDSPDDH